MSGEDEGIEFEVTDRGALKIRFKSTTERVRRQYRTLFRKEIVDGYVCHRDLGGCGRKLGRGVKVEKDMGDGEVRSVYSCPFCGTELVHNFRTPPRWRDISLGLGAKSRYGTLCPYRDPCPYDSYPLQSFMTSLRGRYADAFEKWKTLGFARGLSAREAYIRFRELVFQHLGFVPDIWYSRELGQLVIPPDFDTYERIVTDRVVRKIDGAITVIRELEQLGGILHRTGLRPDEVVPQLERARLMITDGRVDPENI